MNVFIIMLLGVLFLVGCNQVHTCSSSNGYVYNFYAEGKLVGTSENDIQFLNSDKKNIEFNQCHSNGHCVEYHMALGLDSKLLGYNEVINLKFLRKKNFLSMVRILKYSSIMTLGKKMELMMNPSYFLKAISE